MSILLVYITQRIKYTATTQFSTVIAYNLQENLYWLLLAYMPVIKLIIMQFYTMQHFRLCLLFQGNWIQYCIVARETLKLSRISRFESHPRKFFPQNLGMPHPPILIQQKNLAIKETVETKQQHSNLYHQFHMQEPHLQAKPTLHYCFEHYRR